MNGGVISPVPHTSSWRGAEVITRTRLFISTCHWRHAAGELAEALYKQEGPEFDSRLGRWIFQLT
jgi:hypothetical protein